MTHGPDQPVYVVMGGDLVVATFDQEIADKQALVMFAANMDVDTLTCRYEAWREKGRPVATAEGATLTDLTLD